MGLEKLESDLSPSSNTARVQGIVDKNWIGTFNTQFEKDWITTSEDKDLRKNKKNSYSD